MRPVEEATAVSAGAIGKEMQPETKQAPKTHIPLVESAKENPVQKRAVHKRASAKKETVNAGGSRRSTAKRSKRNSKKK
jgi:hypothetical protein